MATATSVLDAKIKRSPGKIGMIWIRDRAWRGSYLLGDPFAARSFRRPFGLVDALHFTGHSLARRTWLRVRQRISRHRKRCSHGYLYPFARATHCGGVVGLLEFSWSVDFKWFGRIRIISLLPVELILQVGSKAGFAMVFALLVAAILWNLGTWYFGLPASSSHTLIGSIIGVGIANQLMSPKTGTSGVDWAQATNIGKSLLLSPIVGFVGAYLLLTLMKAVIKNRALYEAPVGNEPPPFWIRALLLLTCTGVSFAHGSNDGQKGMGLIMLILVGTVPTAYALNHALTQKDSDDFIAVSQQAEGILSKYVSPEAVIGDDREEVTDYIRTKQFTPNTMLALRQLVTGIGNETALFGEMSKIPNDKVRNFRNDMYVASGALRLMKKNKQPDISASDWQGLDNYKRHVDKATSFIPGWVKVAVAMALGLGTMVGWKRIVVTVGEKIGKDHLTYGQGAAAEITAMFTIGAADWFGLPVSTTHVLSSGVAGSMAANHSGLQWGTVRNLAMAWVLTLPASMVLAGFLFWGFRKIF
jgi:PiT family inorganic phosphate transporter